MKGFILGFAMLVVAPSYSRAQTSGVSYLNYQPQIEISQKDAADGRATYSLGYGDDNSRFNFKKALASNDSLAEIYRTVTEAVYAKKGAVNNSLKTYNELAAKYNWDGNWDVGVSPSFDVKENGEIAVTISAFVEGIGDGLTEGPDDLELDQKTLRSKEATTQLIQAHVEKVLAWVAQREQSDLQERSERKRSRVEERRQARLDAIREGRRNRAAQDLLNLTDRVNTPGGAQ
jgi:hypothetical protein